MLKNGDQIHRFPQWSHGIGRVGYTVVAIWLVSFPRTGLASLLLAWGPILLAERLGPGLTLFIGLATLMIAALWTFVISSWTTFRVPALGHAETTVRPEGALPTLPDSAVLLSGLR